MMKIDSAFFSAPYAEHMHYVVATPEKRAGKLPMMVFLHGVGERGEDTKLLATHGPLKYAMAGKEYPCILLCPQCPTDRFWPQLSEQLHSLILRVAEEYGADPDRISLTGLSMGGYGTWELACSHPETFCAIAPCCGGGQSFRAFELKNVPVWACHGEADECVPIVQSLEMVDAINRCGGKADLTILHGVGHNSWGFFYEKTTVLAWLLEQKRQGADRA